MTFCFTCLIPFNSISEIENRKGVIREAFKIRSMDELRIENLGDVNRMRNVIVVTQVNPWIERERNSRCKIIAVIVTILVMTVIGLTTGLVISQRNNTLVCK